MCLIGEEGEALNSVANLSQVNSNPYQKTNYGYVEKNLFELTLFFLNPRLPYQGRENGKNRK